MRLFIPPGRNVRGGRRGALSRLAARVASTFRLPTSLPGRRAWVFYAIVAFMGFGLLGGDRGLVKLVSLIRDRATLNREIRDLTIRKAQLELQLYRYTSDPETIERVVREQLDLVRKGETVYKFPQR